MLIVSGAREGGRAHRAIVMIHLFLRGGKGWGWGSCCDYMLVAVFTRITSVTFDELAQIKLRDTSSLTDHWYTVCATVWLRVGYLDRVGVPVGSILHG